MTELLAWVLVALADLIGTDSTERDLDRWTEEEDARNGELIEQIERDDDKATEEALRYGETYIPWHAGGPEP